MVALVTPSDRQKTQCYYQRYVEHFPSAGEIVLFDRSWYNRAGVERVMGFCSEAEVQEFMLSCPEFERMLVRSGIRLIKYWFLVGPEAVSYPPVNAAEQFTLFYLCDMFVRMQTIDT